MVKLVPVPVTVALPLVTATVPDKLVLSVVMVRPLAVAPAYVLESVKDVVLAIAATL